MDHEAVTHDLAQLLRLSTEDVEPGVMTSRICSATTSLLGLEGAGVMIIGTDGNRHIDAVSEAASDMEMLQEATAFGPCADAEAAGQTVLCGRRSDLERWPRLAATAATHGICSVAAIPLMSRGRCWGVLSLYARPEDVWDAATTTVAGLLADGLTTFLVVTADRRRARLAEVQLTHDATHDHLTGLFNRAGLLARLQQHVDRAESDESQVAVGFINIDSFASVNHTHGHSAGDHVLREVAQRLRSQVDPADTVARIGGDTFVVAHTQTTNPGKTSLAGHALARAEHIHRSLRQPIELEHGEVSITARIGIAVSGGAIAAESLIDEADHALFEADPHLAHPTGLRQFDGIAPALAHSDPHLPLALERDALTVHYQPLVAARVPHQVVAAEALMRWTTPDGKVIDAASFIDVASQRGLMPAFTAWLINEVCRQVAQWDEDLGAAAPAEVFINLGARELNDPTLPATLASALSRNGLQAERIGLEVVEQAFVHSAISHRVNELRERGHPVAIDDFGTGHSSLARLTALTVDLIKLDKSLTAVVARDPLRTDFMHAVVQLARTLGARIVAEGIETVQQRDALMTTGADLLQGFLLALPQPAEEFSARLLSEAPTMLVRHLLTGEAFSVSPSTVGQAIGTWFPRLTPDVELAIEQLEEHLAQGRSSRRQQNYLGIEITRTTGTSPPDAAAQPPMVQTARTRPADEGGAKSRECSISETGPAAGAEEA